MYLLLNPWVIKKLENDEWVVWSGFGEYAYWYWRENLSILIQMHILFFLQAENLLLICLAIVRLYLNWVKSRCCWLCVVAACCANLDRSRDTWHVTAPHDNTSHSQASHADSRPAPGPCVLARSWPTSDRFHLVFLTTHCEILEVNLSVELIKTYQ